MPLNAVVASLNFRSRAPRDLTGPRALKGTNRGKVRREIRGNRGNGSGEGKTGFCHLLDFCIVCRLSVELSYYFCVVVGFMYVVWVFFIADGSLYSCLDFCIVCWISA